MVEALNRSLVPKKPGPTPARQESEVSCSRNYRFGYLVTRQSAAGPVDDVGDDDTPWWGHASSQPRYASGPCGRSEALRVD
jgi:hypothetical protein